MNDPIIVLKFGGSVITNVNAIDNVVRETRRWIEQGRRAVVVVSAIGDATDQLLRLAGDLADPPDAPDPHALAALLATGETRSAAACALALHGDGLATTLLQPHQLALRACGDPVDASPVAFDEHRLRNALDAHEVVVTPGFIACDERGDFTLLGRGGSDLTALFIAHRLHAECRLVKDVDGWYDADPATHPDARRYVTLNWNDAAERPAPIVQTKAVRFARDIAQPFDVAALDSNAPTRIGDHPTTVASLARKETRQ